MDFAELIKKRSSVRKFNREKTITDSQIKQLLEMAILTPSEGNLQPWYFVVVRDGKVKSKLYEAALKQQPVKEAPVVIVTCLNKEKTFWKYGLRGTQLYAIQSTALATYQLWLAAVNEGLAGCWIGAFDEEQVSQILGLSKNLRPVVLLCLGYAGESPELTKRESIDKVTEYK